MYIFLQPGDVLYSEVDDEEQNTQWSNNEEVRNCLIINVGLQLPNGWLAYCMSNCNIDII